MNLRRSLENLFKGPQAVLPMTRSKDDPHMAVPVTADDPLPVTVVGGSVGGGGTVQADPDSAREVTLQQVRDAVQALAPLLGNTDTLEALAATNRDLLQNIGTYTDGLEGLLSLLNANTDDLEALLNALGVNDQNVIGKLEALRFLAESTNTHMQAANGNSYILASQAQGDGIKTQLPAEAATQTTLEAVRTQLAGTLTVQGGVSVSNLPATQAISAASLPLPTGAATQATLAQVLTALQGTLTTQRAAQATTSSLLTIAANASLSDSVTLMGRSLVRLTIGANWTAADLTVQTSPDGNTWNDLYDEYGAPYLIKAAASRTVFIAPGPLLAVNYIRLRSGTPAAPVSQTATATLTLASVVL